VEMWCHHIDRIAWCSPTVESVRSQFTGARSRVWACEWV